MSSGSLVLTDNSVISRLDRILLRVEYVMIVVSGLAVFGLMLLAVLSVGGRNFFNAPLPGYVDWIEQFMPVIAIFGVSYVRREGAHIRMDIVVGALRGRALWLAELLTTLAILLLVVLLLRGSWMHFDRSIDLVPDTGLGDWIRAISSFSLSDVIVSRDSTMDINLPIWPAKLVVPVALFVLLLRLLLQVAAYTRALIFNIAQPAAVPLVADVATQAAMESAQVTGHDD